MTRVALIAMFILAERSSGQFLSGIVREDSTERPLSGVEIALDRNDRTTRSTSTGRYLLSDLPEGWTGRSSIAVPDRQRRQISRARSTSRRSTSPTCPASRYIGAPPRFPACSTARQPRAAYWCYGRADSAHVTACCGKTWMSSSRVPTTGQRQGRFLPFPESSFLR